MGEFIVEAPGRKKPLAALPRGRARNEFGEREDPVVEIDLDFGRHAAGCAICDRPIPPETTRIMVRIWLRTPRPLGNGKRKLTEKYYLHPGCITDRVRPEILRTRMDCYDCGAIPEQRKDAGLIYWADRCFTVSKFAHAPLCPTCAEKPRWMQCQSCSVWYPHHMIDIPIGVAGPIHEMCGYCARRHNVPLQQDQEQAEADFEKLRAEIAEYGVFRAGDE